jgi:hypothetical protein
VFCLNVNSNKKEYIKVATYDMATIISQNEYFRLSELNINKVFDPDEADSDHYDEVLLYFAVMPLNTI